MPANPKARGKFIAALSRLIQQEEKEIYKISTYWRISGSLGTLLIFVSILESLEPHWKIWQIVSCGVAGGFFLGLSALFSASRHQWPLLKPFLDEERILEAEREIQS